MMEMNTQIKSVSTSAHTVNITSNCSNSSLLPCALMTVLVVASSTALSTAPESDGTAQASMNEIIASTRAPGETNSPVKNVTPEPTTAANCTQNQTQPAVPVLSNSTEDYLDCFCPFKIFKGISGGLPQKITTSKLESFLGHGFAFQHVTVEGVLGKMNNNELSALDRAVDGKSRTNGPENEENGRETSLKNSQVQNVQTMGGDNKKSNPADAKILDGRNADSVEVPSDEEVSNEGPKERSAIPKRRVKNSFRLEKLARASPGKPKIQNKNFLRGEKSEEEAEGKPKKQNKNFLRGEKSEEEETEGNAKKNDLKLLRTAKHPRKRVNSYALRNTALSDDMNAKPSTKKQSSRTRTLANGDDQDELPQYELESKPKRRYKNFLRLVTEEGFHVPERQNSNSKKRNQKHLRISKVSLETSGEEQEQSEKQNGKAKNREPKFRSVKAPSANPESPKDDIPSEDKSTGKPKKRNKQFLRLNSAEESKDELKPPKEGPQGRSRKKNDMVRMKNQTDIEELQGQSQEQNQNNAPAAKARKLLRTAKTAQQDSYDYDEKPKGTAKKRNKSSLRDLKNNENDPDLLQGKQSRKAKTKVRTKSRRPFGMGAELFARAMEVDDSTSPEDYFNGNVWILSDSNEPDYSEEMGGRTGAQKLNPSSLKIAQMKQERLRQRASQAKKLALKNKALADYYPDYKETESEENIGRTGGLRPIRRKPRKKRPKFATAIHNEDDKETESEDETGQPTGRRSAKRLKLRTQRQFRVATAFDHDEDEPEDDSEDAAGRFSWKKIVKILNPKRRKSPRGLFASEEDETSSAENDGEREAKTRDQSMLRRANGNGKKKDIREPDSSNDSDSQDESVSNEKEQIKGRRKHAKKKSKKHKKGKRRGRSAFLNFSALEHGNLCICLPRLSNVASTLGETHLGKIAEKPSDGTSVTLEVARKEQPDLKIQFRPI